MIMLYIVIALETLGIILEDLRTPSSNPRVLLFAFCFLLFAFSEATGLYALMMGFLLLYVA